MNFDLSDDQRQMRDSLARLLKDRYGFEEHRRTAASAEGWSRGIWGSLVELGLTALPLPEAHGGLGGSAADMAVVMEELGAALTLAPYLSTVVLAARAIELAGDAALKRSLLPEIAAGRALLAWAHDEPAGRHARRWIETAARGTGEGWVLDGSKANVLYGASAGMLIVSARVAGAPGDAGGRGLFLVNAGAPGMGLRAYRLLDGTPAASLTLSAVSARPLGTPGAAGAVIDAVVDAAIAALCAEATGAMRAAFAMTVAYLNTRKQFGRLIGENQALRHRVAEMHVAMEACRSAALLAAIAIDDPASCDAPRDLAGAKLLIGRHGRFVCQQAVQLHGGIGMTDEYAVGHTLQRLTVIDQLMGDADTHLAALADMAH